MTTPDTSATDPAPTRSGAAEPLPIRPGKIVAVHLSYASRADQRGRRPASPSYFFKPSSSLTGGGGYVERPAGTELLAFEGEIALVIARAARRVPLDDAWSYVGWVTASNDLGLYDLRAADRGSNVRSKGGDGYTPIGPRLLDATTLDPTRLRVRTWVGDELRQHDTTAGLIFPLAQIIADLSQHFTLQAGDVILTGTPAGSSVIEPGQTVAVEVDSPGTPGAPTTGRLLTTVTEGKHPFDNALGALPTVDDEQRAEAWGTGPSGAALGEQLVAKLRRVAVADISAELRKRGLDDVHIDGVAALKLQTKLLGTARTLRFVPHRRDLFGTRGGGYNAQKRLFDTVGEGEVIVIEARGELGSGTLGDILALRARSRGAAGVVSDGGVRDAAAVAATGLPVFAGARHPAVLGRKHVPWDVDLTIACGGATVVPGDVIVGDDDGVVVIPRAHAEAVADAALAQAQQDAWVAEKVAAGNPVAGLFPPDATWSERYRQERSR